MFECGYTCLYLLRTWYLLLFSTTSVVMYILLYVEYFLKLLIFIFLLASFVSALIFICTVVYLFAQLFILYLAQDVLCTYLLCVICTCASDIAVRTCDMCLRYR